MSNTDFEFNKFPKIPRWNREWIITEKIDGTNAQIIFDTNGNVTCCSRNRVINPNDDNFGFAQWVYENQEALYYMLGVGKHYGEWWGAGIQRRYGLDSKRFSLFNAKRWGDILINSPVEGVHVVPVLYEGLLKHNTVENAMHDLVINGSYAAKGFMKPEGIVIHHLAGNNSYKVTFEHDEFGKPELGETNVK